MPLNSYRTKAITNLDATPIVRANPWVHGGNAKQFSGTIEAVAGDSFGSTYRFFRIGSWMRPVSLTLFHDAIYAGGDFGLYRTRADGGAACATGLFAIAVAMADENRVGANIRFDQDDIANVEKRIWELLGLTADPNLEYDVTLTLASPVRSSGTLSLQGVFSW